MVLSLLASDGIRGFWLFVGLGFGDVGGRKGCEEEGMASPNGSCYDCSIVCPNSLF